MLLRQLAAERAKSSQLEQLVEDLKAVLGMRGLALPPAPAQGSGRQGPSGMDVGGPTEEALRQSLREAEQRARDAHRQAEVLTASLADERQARESSAVQLGAAQQSLANGRQLFEDLRNHAIQVSCRGPSVPVHPPGLRPPRLAQLWNYLVAVREELSRHGVDIDVARDMLHVSTFLARVNGPMF